MELSGTPFIFLLLCLRFEGYTTRYREGLDLVLRGIDLTILRGEKVVLQWEYLVTCVP